VVEEGIRHFEADVAIGQSGPPSDGATLAEIPSKLMDRIDDGVPVRQLFIEIHSHDTPERRVIAVIELLSHSNKSAGRGREEYLAKQKNLQVSTHLRLPRVACRDSSQFLCPSMQRILPLKSTSSLSLCTPTTSVVLSAW
jgi:Protein of unknown function (DUF4058)